MDQRAAQAELLLHAAGELAGGSVGEGREPGCLQQLGDARSAFGTRVTEQAPEEIDVLEHRQRGIEVLAQSLRHVGDPRTHGAAMLGIGHVAIEHVHAAVLDRARPGDEAEQARLAHPVRPDEADHAAGRKIEIHCAEGRYSTIAVGHAAQSGDRSLPTRELLTAAA